MGALITAVMMMAMWQQPGDWQTSDRMHGVLNDHAGTLHIQTAPTGPEPPKCLTQCVEPLTPKEIEMLKVAKLKADNAASEYEEVVNEVKERHGQPIRMSVSGTMAIMMCYPYNTVELWGNYALITYTSHSCVSW